MGLAGLPCIDWLLRGRLLLACLLRTRLLGLLWVGLMIGTTRALWLLLLLLVPSLLACPCLLVHSTATSSPSWLLSARAACSRLVQWSWANGQAIRT